ncbi:MAG TPA: HEAT repeat domain-containing protein [Anaerolineales bacterium]|nr:HEAT repeat domain-containing protein [Anaerolineales bacterium]
MLDKLDTIHWNELTHAFGDASDLPILIRALASDQRDEREEAFGVLYTNIWHHGVVFEASAFVVPFLVELVEHADNADRGEILVLLAHLATGNSLLEIHQQIEGPEALDSPELKVQLARERQWVLQTRQTTQRFIPTYVRLLEDPDPDVRAASAYLLACFRGEARKIAPIILRRLGKEKHARSRASLVLCLGALANGNPSYLQCFESIRKSNLPDLVRLAAAMAEARNLRETTPDETLELLVDVITNIDPLLPAEYKRLPWADGHVAGDASLVLCYFGPQRAVQAIPDLLQALHYVDAHSALHIVYTLLFSAFGGRKGQSWQAKELNNSQRLVLTALLDNETVWEQNLDMAELLRMFGLPDWPDTLGTFLNLGLP